MSYRLERSESVEAGLRRIASEQIDKALAEIDDEHIDRHETVHQVRKRCKKLRGLVRLVRPGFPDYKRVNTYYRDAARDLSDIRDAHAVVETVDDLLDHFDEAIDRDAFRGLRERLVERREETDADRESIDRRISRFRDAMLKGRSALESWALDENDRDAVAAGVRKTYKRARKARKAAAESPTTDAFHEWRKRVKYHWYHARLLSNCWPRLLKPWAREAHRLSDLLGDEHDLAVLHGKLLEAPDRFGGHSTLQAFTGLIERRRAELRAESFQLGAFLLFEKPGQLERRVQVYFDAWRTPAEPLTAPAPEDGAG